jgi:hypothetical protein
MTDRPLVEKRLAVIDTCKDDLVRFAACITQKLEGEKDQAAATEPPRNV